MNILCDFITLSLHTGAGEYLRRVTLTLLDNINETDIRFYALWDSSRGIAYDDMTPQEINKEYEVTFIDIHGVNLSDIVKEYNIDNFFVGCAQYVINYKGFESLQCKVICVIHDLASQELSNENLDAYLQFEKHKGIWSFLNWYWRKRTRDVKRGNMQPVINLLQKNPNASLVVVSEATKQSVRYHLRVPEEKIRVLYSPERIYTTKDSQVDKSNKDNAARPNVLLDIQDKRFFLLMGLERRAKNGMKVVRAFQKYVEDNGKDYLLLTIGYKGKPLYPQHLPVSFLSDEDLHWAYEHCQALIYPSFFEGFGYPPLEAMSCGKPVIASNIAPIREILGDAPTYFCPFFESDIYQALGRFDDSNYDTLCQRAKECHAGVCSRQKEDLATIVQMIMS